MKSHFTLSLILLLFYAAPAAPAPLGTRTVLDNGATLLVAGSTGPIRSTSCWIQLAISTGPAPLRSAAS